MTLREYNFYTEHFNDRFVPVAGKHTHSVIEEFDKRFMVADFWVCLGHPLMQKVRRWAKKHPDDVRIVHCDDAAYSSSIIVLIEHKTARTYHGTTVIFIPQTTEEAPMRMFLYSKNTKELLGVLRQIHRVATATELVEAQDNLKTARAWKKLVKLPKPTAEAY